MAIFVQMPLSTGDTRRLVISIELSDIGFSTYEYAEEQLPRHRFTSEGVFNHTLSPRLEPLKEDVLTVQVILIGKYLDRVTLSQEFWFILSRADLTIVPISPSQTRELP
jgi:hypothetical protein